MKDVLVAVISGILGAGFFGFIQFLISRKDNKDSKFAGINEKLTKIDKKLAKAELDSCRTQMLVLMASYPMEEAELMKLAEHYFNDLKGDWYMTSLFNKHLINNNIIKPEWLRSDD